LIRVRLGKDGRWLVAIEDDGAAFELTERWSLRHDAQEAALAWRARRT
jgi:hypothetical protein